MKVVKKKPRVVLACLGLIALAAAWQYSIRNPSWDESVLLSDGRQVRIHQQREYQPGYGTHKSALTFKAPNTNDLVTWNETLYPVILDELQGKVYLIGRPRGSQQYETYGYPRYMYVAFMLDNGKFQRIPFLSVPDQLRRKENIRWCFPGGSDDRVLQPRQSPAWCDDMDPSWPTPQVVDLKVRAAESQSWVRGYGGAAVLQSE